MRYLFSILLDGLAIISFPFFYIYRRKNNLYLFTEWNGEPKGDNPSVLFQHMTNVEKYWITNEKQKHLDGLFVYKYSFRSFLLHILAGNFVFSHNIRTQFIWPLCINSRKILIWHGVPLKKIGLQRSYSWSTDLWRFYSKKVRLRITPINLVFCQSEYEKKIVSEAFNIKPASIMVTGYPSYCKFIGVNTRDRRECTPSKKRVLYAPTLRDSSDVFVLILAEYFNCVALNSDFFDFYIKLHPAQVQSHDLIAPAVLNLCKSADIDYGFFDFVITDYSGVAVEATLCDCKLYMYAPDVLEYSTCVGLNELFYEFSKNMRSSLNEIVEDMRCGQKFTAMLTARDYYVGAVPSANVVKHIANLLVAKFNKH